MRELLRTRIPGDHDSAKHPCNILLSSHLANPRLAQFTILDIKPLSTAPTAAPRLAPGLLEVGIGELTLTICMSASPSHVVDVVIRGGVCVACNCAVAQLQPTMANTHECVRGL